MTSAAKNKRFETDAVVVAVVGARSGGFNPWELQTSHLASLDGTYSIRGRLAGNVYLFYEAGQKIFAPKRRTKYVLIV